MRMDPASIRLPGAVDLGALRSPAGGGQGQEGSGSPHVIDVTEATFQTEVVERSQTVPVVLDFWASWCGPCRQLSPVLERLAAADGGAWVLAKIDCDANPRLAQAAGVQGIPAVKAVVDGALVSEFTGALPEQQVRTWLDQLLAAVQERNDAAAAGGPDAAGGPGGPGGVGAAQPPMPEDPDLDRAEQALADGDLEASAEAFRAKLAKVPGDPDATVGLARVELLQRASAVDQAALQARLTENPQDIPARLELADLQVAAGQPEPGLAGLVELIKETSGEDRETVRTHLLALFSALGEHDPAVAPARKALARALF